MRRWLAPLGVLLVLAGCASEPEAPARREEAASQQPAARQPASRSGLSPAAQRALAKHGMQPHDTRPVSVKSQCSRVDEIGTATTLKLDVGEGEVSNFNANILIKGRGRCRFDLADFRQESREPQVILRHARDQKCTVRMWREQTEQVTIAFTGCQKSCEGRAFDYLWPILVESKTGQCS
jgi:hypothetical protein